MGKRKSQAKVQAKAKVRSSTVFDCPLCDNVKCIEISISKVRAATLKCRQCGAGAINIPTTGLTQAIDVFSDWIDSVKDIQEQSKPAPRQKQVSKHEDDSEGEDDFY